MDLSFATRSESTVTIVGHLLYKFKKYFKCLKLSLVECVGSLHWRKTDKHKEIFRRNNKLS